MATNDAAQSPLEAIRKEFQKQRADNKKLPEAIQKAFVAGFDQTFGVDFKENLAKVFTAITSPVKNFAVGIKENIEGFASSVWSGLKMMTSFVIGFIALGSFLTGFEKAVEWFGENADFGDKLASGFAYIIATFTGITEKDTVELANAISVFFDALGTVATSIAKIAMTIVPWVQGEITITEMMGNLSSLGQNLWDAKEELLLVSMLLAPGATFRLAIAGISAAFSLISLGLGVIIPVLTTIGGIVTSIGSGIAAMSVGFAAIVPVIATIGLVVGLIINTVRAIQYSIEAFKSKFEQTGSIMDGLVAFAAEFVAQFIGWPIELMASLVDWVANLLGFEDIIGDIDIVGMIRTSIIDFANDTIAYFTGLWDYISTMVDDTIESIKEYVESYIPDWMKSGEYGPETNFNELSGDSVGFGSDASIEPLPQSPSTDKLSSIKRLEENLSKNANKPASEQVSARQLIAQQNIKNTNNFYSTPVRTRPH